MDETEVISTLLSAGPLGAIIVLLCYALWRQTGELRASQEARVEDAKKVTDTLLKLNDKWNTTVTALTDAVKELKNVVHAVDRR